MKDGFILLMQKKKKEKYGGLKCLNAFEISQLVNGRPYS